MIKKFIIGLIGFISLIGPIASASTLSGYAWSSNIGWIKFSGPTYGVNLDDVTGDLSGHAWSSNIGWVKFNGNGTNLAEWGSGLIKLKGSTYGISSDYNNCRLNGWAWGSDVIGWINFSGNGYGVKIDDCSPIDPPIEIPRPICQFSAFPERVSKGGRSTLTWNCNGTADMCQIAGSGLQNGGDSGQIRTNSLLQKTVFNLQCSNAGGSSDFTTEVRVVVPVYCEIIPFLGTCR